MDSIRSYLTAIVAVCLIAVLTNGLVRQGQIRKLVRLSSGILIVLTVFSPLLSIDLPELGEKLLQPWDTREYTQDFEEKFQAQLRKNIQETTQRYIQEKASELGAYVQATVELSNDEYPVPIAVRIEGSLNYEQLEALRTYVTNSLGIAKERQEWNIYGSP